MLFFDEAALKTQMFSNCLSSHSCQVVVGNNLYPGTLIHFFGLSEDNFTSQFVENMTNLQNSSLLNKKLLLVTIFYKMSAFIPLNILITFIKTDQEILDLINLFVVKKISLAFVQLNDIISTVNQNAVNATSSVVKHHYFVMSCFTLDLQYLIHFFRFLGFVNCYILKWIVLQLCSATSLRASKGLTKFYVQNFDLLCAKSISLIRN